MRQDQIERLKELTEQLADRFLIDADPTEWPDDGRLPAELTQKDRGNAVWCRKMAMATGGVLKTAIDLIAKNAPGPGEGKPGDIANDSDMEKMIADAERKATEHVNRVVSKAKAQSVQAGGKG